MQEKLSLVFWHFKAKDNVSVTDLFFNNIIKIIDSLEY